MAIRIGGSVYLTTGRHTRKKNYVEHKKEEKKIIQDLKIISYSQEGQSICFINKKTKFFLRKDD